MKFDLEARQLKETIIRLCNQSMLPMEMKQYILKDIYGQCKAEADKIVLAQLEEMQKETDEVVEKSE